MFRSMIFVVEIAQGGDRALFWQGKLFSEPNEGICL